MEQERQHFGRMMKDARRKFKDFVVNLEKANPFLLERVTRGDVKKNGLKMVEQTNNVCYKRLSCNVEKSEEDIRLANTRKAKSFNKRRNRPNVTKKRFRHSVIGNGREFSDLEEALLLDAVSDYDNDDGTKCTAEDAFIRYFANAYNREIRNEEQSTNKEETKRNYGVEIADLLNLGDTTDEIQRLKIKRQIGRKPRTSRSLANDLEKMKTNAVLRKKVPGYAETNSRFNGADLSRYSVTNTDDSGSVIFSREEKRRLKQKMRQAFKKPESYSYMGNL